MDDKPLDAAHLSEMSGDDREFECELLQEFLNSTPPIIEKMEQAVTGGDLRSVQLHAHTLKGSCRSLGANPMAEPCETIEALARSGDLVDAPGHCEEVRARFDELRLFLEQTWDLKAA